MLNAERIFMWRNLALMMKAEKSERGSNELGLKYEYSILLSIWKVVLQKSNVDIYCTSTVQYLIFTRMFLFKAFAHLFCFS